MLKLYTNTAFLKEDYRRMVFPLLFDLHFLKHKALGDVYTLVDRVEACDIVVFPIDYLAFLKYNKAFKVLHNQAKAHNKPIWIYSGGDFGFTNFINNSFTFRLGGFDSLLPENTCILPSFINDPYSHQLPQGFESLKKQERPSLGFVGHAKSGLKKYLKETANYYKFNIKRILKAPLADAQSFYPSSVKRASYLSKLAQSTNLETNFVLRSQYRAGVDVEAQKAQSTREFYDNIFSNAYTFCSRGVGNFSVRFYETLAVGRIPVLLNTDCRLPLVKQIDWTKHCVILDESLDLTLEEQILAFHASHSEASFEKLQVQNRKLWESHLRRDAYFIQIHDHFVNLNSKCS